MTRRAIQAVPMLLFAVFVTAGYLGLRAIVWRQEFEAVGMFQTGLVISGIIGAAVAAAYVLMGSLLWRLLNLDWLSLQFGSLLGSLLYGGYNAVTPLSPYSVREPPLWRALQGGMDGLLLGLFIGAVVMVVSRQPLHLDRGGLLRFLILYITVILLAWLVLLTQTLIHLPDVVGLVAVVPVVLLLRLAVATLDRRADSRAYRYEEL